jgi:hypothetical protein
MVKTRRSSHNYSGSSLDSFKDRKHQRILGELATGIQRLGRGTLDCFGILEALFPHSISGLWFRILPVDGYDDDICHALRVSWKVLLPLVGWILALQGTGESLSPKQHVG